MRGRPSDEYPRDEFVASCRLRMDALGISQTALADQSLVRRGERLVPVNRGTASKIFSGKCPAPPEVRMAFMHTLQFDPELEARFSGVSPSHAHVSKPMLISDYHWPQAPTLSTATTLLHLGFYSGAARELRRVFAAAANSGDIILQANAAARAELVYLEMGDFREAERWARTSIAKCSEYVGMPLAEIVRSARPLSPDGSLSGDALVSRILSDSLHNLCQIFVRQMLYCGADQLEQSASSGLACVLELDRRLDLSQPAGNDLRCKAVMEVTRHSPSLKPAVRLIGESKERFVRGGLFEAHSVKTLGIAYLQTGKPAQGRDRLIKAEELLSSFQDARGLAFTLYLLSDAILRTSGNRRQALRAILAAAALHPYGVLIDRCKHQAAYTNRRDLQSEIDDLIAGKRNYRSVHQMMAWLAQDSSYTAEDLLHRNLDLMVAGGFPHVEFPARLTLGTVQRLPPALHLGSVSRVPRHDPD